MVPVRHNVGWWFKAALTGAVAACFCVCLVVLLPLRDAFADQAAPAYPLNPVHAPRGPSQSKRTGGGGHAKTQPAVTYEITETYRWPTNSLPTIDMKIEDRPPDHRIVTNVLRPALTGENPPGKSRGN
jgi:hypothetical protein